MTKVPGGSDRSKVGAGVAMYPTGPEIKVIPVWPGIRRDCSGSKNRCGVAIKGCDPYQSQDIILTSQESPMSKTWAGVAIQNCQI